MFQIGLCSVTFRNLSVEEIIEAAKNTDIQGIEWGGDIHVPPGDLEHAAYAANITRQAEIDIISYGSYYRLGVKEQPFSFEAILDTAEKLTAPAIRVWAGNIGSSEATERQWEKVIEDAKRIADLAEKQGIHINLEYHGRTLTDTADSAIRLMKKINHSNVSLYWQPSPFETVNKNMKSIDTVRQWLSHVHVFHWQLVENNVIVYPFSAGISDWEKYLQQLEKQQGMRYLMMEFVKEDSIEQLKNDVKVLQSIITSYSAK